jgi:hypothetical protein
MRRPSTFCTSLFVLLAVTSAAAAQELPKVKEEPIPVAERQRLRELLDIVEHADRVVALPVKATSGEGLSTQYDVVEKPVKVDLETGRSLGRRLVRYDWAGWSASACMFNPAVAFRFYNGARSTQVQICFMCGEMALDGIHGLYANKKALPGGDRKPWLRAARKAFPNEQFVELP